MPLKMILLMLSDHQPCSVINDLICEIRLENIVALLLVCVFLEFVNHRLQFVVCSI